MREELTALWHKAAADDPAIWIHRLSLDELEPYLQALEGRDPEDPALPLFGLPFAIKDNIDLAGVPTTAACPDFAYTPERSACVVERLVAAGAIPMGKTNLDQFATGLVGTRSPYGVPGNAINPAYIPGGSSSGSAVAVARGLVAFALGTDTAGSGRVPAAFNGLVGLKPTLGRLSTRGVVPACRSLDCVSVFTRNAADARAVLEVASAFDPEDAWCRHRAPLRSSCGASFRFGVPRPEQLKFFGNQAYAERFVAALDRLEAVGGQRVELDFEPFLEAARLLYEGPWVAERYAAIESLITERPEALLPVTRSIIEGGIRGSAVDAFKARYRLAELKRQAEPCWQQVDVMVTPTAGTHYTLAEVEADPITLNSNLGYYTNFMNLLDCAAVAVPAGETPAGMPFGITLFSEAWRDEGLLDLAGRFSGEALPERRGDWIEFAVCGAHMEGLPLNHQITDRGGRLVRRTHSAACYRMFLLKEPPPRPGMIRDLQGASLELEVWSLPPAEYGLFVNSIPAPLGFGRIELEDGSSVQGFLCEGQAVEGAKEITPHGGWRNYLSAS